MSSCPVLALLDFTQPFMLECDTSGEGIEVVLIQDHHHIAFKSRKLKEYERLYSTYVLAIMHALAKFRQYLVGNKFKVKTDHNNLQFFLEQKDLNERQQKWVSKIEAYDFEIEYVKGKNNVVVDSLSRRPNTILLFEISVEWKEHLLVEYSKNRFAYEILDGQVQDDRYRVIDDVIYYKDIIYLVP